MTTQVLPGAASVTPLAAAAALAAAVLEEGLEPLSTPEAQAFASWLHAAYLSIFLHVDDQAPTQTLLSGRICRMENQGSCVLTSTKLSSVATLASELLGGFYLRTAPFPKLNSRALFSLAARLPLGPMTKALVVWVDIAYGDAPRDYNQAVPYFAVRADGSLYRTDMPVLEVFTTTDMAPDWQTLPAFWRVMYVVSKTTLPYKGAADAMMQRVISTSALPLVPYSTQAVSFLNYAALLQNYYMIFGPESQCDRTTVMLHRLMHPWSGTPIRGAYYAEEWLRWMVSQVLEGDVFLPNSIYKTAFLRIVYTPALNLRTTSLEAIGDVDSADAADAPFVKKNPDSKRRTVDDNDTSDPKQSIPDASGDADLDPEDPNADPTSPPDDDLSPTVDETETVAETDKNNNIGDITLEQDDDPGRAYLYRRKVLALDDVLGRDPDIKVNQTVRESLHQWCRDWLWLANVDVTKSLINDLGLQKTLGPVDK